MKIQFIVITIFFMFSVLVANENKVSTSHIEKARIFYSVSGMGNWKKDFANKMYSIQLLAHADEIEEEKLKEIVAKTILKYEEDINIQSVQLIWKQFTENELDTLINLFSGSIGKKLLELETVIANSEDVGKLYKEMSQSLSAEIEKAIKERVKR